MNRMIKLFQSKADIALEKHIQLSQGVANSVPMQAAAQMELQEHLVTFKVWSKAAELLRKEELNR